MTDAVEKVGDPAALAAKTATPTIPIAFLDQRRPPLDYDPFGENSPLSEANLLVLRGLADFYQRFFR